MEPVSGDGRAGGLNAPAASADELLGHLGCHRCVSAIGVSADGLTELFVERGAADLLDVIVYQYAVL